MNPSSHAAANEEATVTKAIVTPSDHGSKFTAPLPLSLSLTAAPLHENGVVLLHVICFFKPIHLGKLFTTAPGHANPSTTSHLDPLPSPPPNSSVERATQASSPPTQTYLLPPHLRSDSPNGLMDMGTGLAGHSRSLRSIPFGACRQCQNPMGIGAV
ncbi:hypothetical protein AVEN_108586-1 [Araneus ventricosus]|uniref:Uncharacterized protein n=1 Tax=Araneus ventricosus TaxID=182803 RepID=A0A4Y2DJ04_ARAVE|nr:hypothetical protein AVEN_108586-1 [Araneus ventricosus]